MAGAKRRRGAGRPCLESKKAKSKKIEVRVSTLEQKDLLDRADRANLHVSTYLRETGLGREIIAPPSLPNMKAYAELHRIGVNLNQLVRAINRGQVQNMDARIITRLYEEVRQLRLALVRVPS
jgi:hypothetical protein